ncbi:SHOCT domain-containing protein [Oceaniglobus ichthyenteri]|uniref:SHOCT domain-containing protein n=1 Tax=Oceaniglobus ichthyenteri TaxID=2136177 RepID=UPI000D3D85FF|nr:SHOCT domain-containing protein [Oceaniglobus ichthyenteri]
MAALSEEGKRIVSDMAARHGFGEDAVVHMLVALQNGGGTQAQFNHFEFGGMGQWSLGGMTMVGDMFNNQMKARVDALCSDLSGVVQAASVFAPEARSSQSQSQSGSWSGMNTGGSSLFVPQASDWPADLGQPGSQGAQNDMRYAYFPDRQRLAISVGGVVTVYDTGIHQIGGFGQAQSGDQSLTFTSQHGVVRVADLPIVGNRAPDTPASDPIPGALPANPPPRVSMPQQPAPPSEASDEQIFARIERLADFHARGILSDEEFGAKKAELLARL